MSSRLAANLDSVTLQELAQLDLFEDLKERYLYLEGLQACWQHKDVDALNLRAQEHLRIHYLLVLSRVFEETIERAFRRGLVPGTAFFGRGNEATSVGSAICLRADDVLSPMHRNCGAHLAKGHELRRIMAQYLGRADGPTRGRDGNWHLGSPKHNILQMISHIGTMVPITAGAAWAAKYRGQDTVVMSYIGDGGTSTGDFHGGINFAAVHKLPLVLIIENNQIAYKTPLADQFACEVLALKGPGYGVPAYLIDGTDVLLVQQVCRAAVERARRGEGPTLIESVTMRISGHSVYDRFSDYLPMDLHQKWDRERDPIDRYQRYLLDRGLVEEGALEENHQRAREESEDALAFAMASPLPGAAEVVEDVYAL